MNFSSPYARLYTRQFAPHVTAVAIFSLLGAAWGALNIGSSNFVDGEIEAWALPRPTILSADPLPAEGGYDRFWSEEERTPKKKVAEPLKTPANKWRFIGTADQGISLVAVIEINGKRVQIVKIGDALPDGSTVSHIAEGELSFELEGSARTVRLFQENKQ